jgi:hypothetical protein
MGHKVWDGGLATRVQTTEPQNGIGAFMVCVCVCFGWISKNWENLTKKKPETIFELTLKFFQKTLNFFVEKW